MSDLINYKNNNIQILEERKQVLDLRFCNILDGQYSSPKYYLADSKGNRLSKSYYSINKLRDGIHYVVSELDFMYTCGLNDWKLMNGGESSDDITYFRFHYGIISAVNGKIVEIVPVVYNEIWETNSNVIFTRADDTYQLVVYNDKLCINKKDSKIGCINLDVNSSSYGMNIITPIMDRICDFDLDYKDFAHATIGNYEGYLSKEIDIDRYNEFIDLYATLKKGGINTQNYFKKINEALSKILFTEEEVKNILKNKQSHNKILQLKNNNEKKLI